MSYSELLRADIECLLEFPDLIKVRLGWSLENSIENWIGVTITNGRITKLDLRGSIIPNMCLSDLIIPSGVKELDFSNNYIYDEHLNGLILPLGLEKLNLNDNYIRFDILDGFELPPNLVSLYLSDNYIYDNGISELVLPPGLQELDLSNNYIYCNDIEKFFLPPDLTSLDISDNYIKDDPSKNLILPPNIQTLSITHNNYMRLWNENRLLERTKSTEGIKMYSKIQNHYDFLKLKPLIKEIYRGLLFGETEDPILQSLQRIQGVQIVVKEVMTFYNPFI